MTGTRRTVKQAKCVIEKPPLISTKRLEELIEEATVDCYDESEAITGFLCVLQDNIETPFATVVFGSEVIVERIDFNQSGDIVAVCHRGEERQNIPILDLPLPNPKPRGVEWIEAYRRWTRGGF